MEKERNDLWGYWRHARGMVMSASDSQFLQSPVQTLRHSYVDVGTKLFPIDSISRCGLSKKKQSTIYRLTNQSDGLTILAIQSTLGINHPCSNPAKKRRSHRLLPVFLLEELPDPGILFISYSRIAGSTLFLLPDLQTDCPRIFLVTFRKLLDSEKPTIDSFRISGQYLHSYNLGSS